MPRRSDEKIVDRPAAEDWPNEPCATWSEFFATQRLVPLARLSADSGALPAHGVAGLESIARRLEDLVGSPESPARLHGDLWAGNRLIGRESVSWLIDPASFGGHREFDLAMMRLFGGFGEDCFAAYAEATPLGDGWSDRISLHQLAPLTVHAIKFGGGYVDATARGDSPIRMRPHSFSRNPKYSKCPGSGIDQACPDVIRRRPWPGVVPR